MRTERNNAELKILSKIIKDKNYELLKNNNLSKNDFKDYINKDGKQLYLISDIINFIDNYYNQSSQVPDINTIHTKYPELNIDNDGLDNVEPFIKTLKKLNKDTALINIMTQANRIHQSQGSKDAINYLQWELEKLEATSEEVKGYDLVQNMDDRINDFKELQKNPKQSFVSTGFKELDQIITGWLREEELVLIQARSGQSKTFLLLKFAVEAWLQGENVLFFEPEMSSRVIGYRFDAIADENHEISNFALLRGDRFFDINKYLKLAETLKQKKNHFYYLCPDDFPNGCSVTDLKNWCKKNKITFVCIDGIEIPDIIDERKNYGDDEWKQLTHIAADLLRMSKTLKVPIIVTAQAKRTDEKEKLGINTIGGSYGLSRKATLMIVMKKTDKELEIRIEKNRNGKDTNTLNYRTNLDLGLYVYDGAPIIDEKTNEVATDREVGKIDDITPDKNGIISEDIFIDGGIGLEDDLGDINGE